MSFTLSQQQQAVLDWVANGSGHLNLVARAGTGKTATLIEIVKTLPPGSCFLGAYNTAIANEVKGKLRHLELRAHASTMHSAGFAAWRKRYSHVNVEVSKCRDMMRAWLSRGVCKRYESAVLDLVSLAKGCAFGARDCPAVDDATAWERLARHHGIEANLSGGATVEEAVWIAMDLYRRSLDACDTLIDFDDMILAPLVHNADPQRFAWVLIDEAQDTNPARRELAKRMLGPGGRMIAVGDPCQAIYGFTGADADAMDIIVHDMESETLPLTLTYRCPHAIVDEANTIVPDIEAAPDNPTGSVDAIPLYGFLARRKQLEATDVILCRNTAPLVELAYGFLADGIACRVEGRDIGASLLNLVRRWKSVHNLEELADRVESFLPVELEKLMAQGKEAAAQAIEDRCNTVLILCSRLISKGSTRLADLENFVNRLFDTSKPADAQHVLTLSTIHKSKGREWPRVYILGADQYMPSPYARKDWEMAQEDNLLYVAITRARETLTYVNVRND